MQLETKKSKKFPISRNSMFFSDESFMFEEEIAMDYMMNDIRQSVILYAVDIKRSNISTIYGETKRGDIAFKTPVEVPCMYKIEDSELKAYEAQKNLGAYVKTGTLRMCVMNKTQEELGIDIKRGDYIGVIISEDKVQMFTVTNDGRVNNDNKHTMYGTKPYYRTILAAEVNENEFNG